MYAVRIEDVMWNALRATGPAPDRAQRMMRRRLLDHGPNSSARGVLRPLLASTRLAHSYIEREAVLELPVHVMLTRRCKMCVRAHAGRSGQALQARRDLVHRERCPVPREERPRVADRPTARDRAEILEWRDAHAVLLGSISEVSFFALTLLVPAVIALTIPILGVVLAVHGRLVYPVHHIRVHTPEIAEFVVAVYYGGLHVVALLFAGATFVVSLSMRRGAYGGNLARLGFATAALDLAAGYPEVIGPTLWLVCGACFAAWFVGLGVKLYGMPADTQSGARAS